MQIPNDIEEALDVSHDFLFLSKLKSINDKLYLLFQEICGTGYRRS